MHAEEVIYRQDHGPRALPVERIQRRDEIVPHAPMKLSTSTVIVTGFSSGKMIRENSCHGLAPVDDRRLVELSRGIACT